jgi:predicted ATPase
VAGRTTLKSLQLEHRERFGSVLEEPDVGLHPSRIRLLAELLETITDQRGTQVIATTHSPTLLAHLSRKALGHTIAFGRDAEPGDTICSRLQDLDTSMH